MDTGIFSLVVDDLRVKYFGNKHVEHLITCIEKYYPLSVEWTGRLYCGVILYWDYKQRHVTLSITGCVERAMPEYQYNIPPHPHHAQHKQ